MAGNPAVPDEPYDPDTFDERALTRALTERGPMDEPQKESGVIMETVQMTPKELTVGKDWIVCPHCTLAQDALVLLLVERVWYEGGVFKIACSGHDHPIIIQEGDTVEACA